MSVAQRLWDLYARLRKIWMATNKERPLERPLTVRVIESPAAVGSGRSQQVIFESHRAAIDDLLPPVKTWRVVGRLTDGE